MNLLQRPEVQRLIWQSAGALILAIVGYLGLQWLPGQGSSTAPTTSAGVSQSTGVMGIAPVTVPGQPALSHTPRLPDGLQVKDVQSQLAEAQRELSRLQSQVEAGRAAIIASRAEATQLVATGHQAQETVDKLIGDRVRWLTQYETLKTDDRGRCIAASEESLGLALSVLSKERIKDAIIKGWQSALSELISPLEASLKNPESGVSLSPQINQQLLTISQNVRTEHQTLKNDMLTLDRLIEETKSNPPTNQTLTQVDSDRTLAAEKRRDVSERERKKKVDAAALATQQKIDADRIAEDARVAAAEEVERQAKLKLKQEFDRDYSVIKDRLVAFTTEGFELRGASVGKGPVSLSLMQGNGALVRNPAGRQQLAIIVGNSKRDSGGLMMFQGGQNKQQTDDFDRVQIFLLKYGNQMVEQGLLAP